MAQVSERRCRVAGTIALLLGLVLADNGAHADADDQNRVRALVEQGAILPLEQIIVQLRRHHLGHILEAELEMAHGRPVYELEVLDNRCVVWKLRYDASTGQLESREQKER